ncbi:MAG: molecular chaperone TorD family protein [Alphaproteobacteria bacterium]|uniref:Molecular chaperone TorD family protein n=1 Tax=Candidatus Nitrobium versatile TaxID=2884831 RepID=A0A953M0K8_9BACT|nr:molecular chaperone TorD family protein [Candidatus Nitrobium versatile]
MSGNEKDIAEERERTYTFLAGLCLKAPSDLLVDMIRDGSILSVFQDCSGGGTAYRWMQEFIGQAGESPDVGEELEAEHTALFVLPTGVIPHEAVFRDKEKRLGGRITLAVLHFYEKAGAGILDTCREMPDHIGMELGFMGVLCKKERELWGNNEDRLLLGKCIELEKEFLEKHLSAWTYQCCEAIIGCSTSGFYRAVARCIAEFLKREEEYITELHEKVSREGEDICKAGI